MFDWIRKKKRTSQSEWSRKSPCESIRLLTEALLYDRADRVPFTFRLVADDLGTRMLVTGDATTDRVLPAGTEILTLDGRPVTEVIDALLPYASADGSNDAKRIDLLQVQDLLAPAARFDVVYSQHFAPEGDLALTVRTPGSSGTSTEQALTTPRMTAAARRARARLSKRCGFSRKQARRHRQNSIGTRS